MKRSSNQTTDWLDEKTRELRDGLPPKVTVYVRSLAPPLGAFRQQQAVMEQLDSHANLGIIDSVSTKVWGKSICPDTDCLTETGQRIRETMSELTSWQSKQTASVELPFEKAHVESSLAGEEYRRIILPRICLSFHSERDLSLVLPCTVEGVSYSIDEFLDLFAQRHRRDRRVGTSA